MTHQLSVSMIGELNVFTSCGSLKFRTLEKFILLIHGICDDSGDHQKQWAKKFQAAR